ncbi:MAG: response regulator [Candidatus Aureabacteria bacterium]|nr:response regulator [Candidatus Auribacterota bacterium]
MEEKAILGESERKERSILIVDDDEQLLYLIKVRLENAHYKTHLARNSEEAFQILKSNKISLIILDIVLPGRNGYEICYEIKGTEELSHIPVIMLSQKGKTKDRYDAARIGADGYISKPFEGSEMIYKVEAVLKEFNEDLEIDTKRMFFPLDDEGYVLVVEDSSSMRKIIKNTLRQLGILRIIEAENGKDAVEKLEQEKIRLILSDWKMPSFDGLQLLDLVKRNSRFSEIPFIMISTEVAEKEIEKVLERGADGYIPKPFTKVDLKKTLEKLNKKGDFYAHKG